MHHGVLELIFERSYHYSLKRVLSGFFPHSFFKFKLSGMLHKESGLDLSERFFRIQLQDTLQLLWTVDKEVKVHSKVIDCIDFSIN